MYFSSYYRLSAFCGQTLHTKIFDAPGELSSIFLQYLGRHPVAMSAITLRHGTYDDFSLLVQWAVDEFEWELSTSDYLNYNSFLPSGWFWAAENERKETVGFICAVEHGPNDGYIGLFFVRKDQRGNGIGKPLLENALKILEGRNITLVAGKYEALVAALLAHALLFRTARHGYLRKEKFHYPP